MDKHVVTCQNCGGHDTLLIDAKNNVFFTEHLPIISARYRPDGKWGFECTCGQDSRLAYQERDQLQVLVRGGDHIIKKIRKALKPNNELKFRMEPA